MRETYEVGADAGADALSGCSNPPRGSGRALNDANDRLYGKCYVVEQGQDLHARGHQRLGLVNKGCVKVDKGDEEIGR